MNIAIYDKAHTRGEQLQQRLRQYWRARSIVCDTALYGCAQSFCHAARSRAIDLAFIFLEADPADGFAAAQALREISMDCELVFAADTPEFAAMAAAFRAMGYLILPTEDAALDEALRRFLAHYRQRAHQYAVHTRLRDCLVPHDRILYFRSDGHAVHVYVEGMAEPLTHLRRLDDIQRETAALGYVRCHQSYLVNRDAVAAVDGRTLVLRDGTRLPVSKRYVSNVVTNVEVDVELHNNSQKSEEQC